MKIRERIGTHILLRHIEDSYWEPYKDGTDMGTAYYKIEAKWLNLAERISGCSYKDIIQKAVGHIRRGHEPV